MNINNFKIGQIIYLLKYSDKSLVEYKIKSIGRKYLKVWNGEDSYSIIDFDMTDDFRHSSYCGSKFKLYFSKEEAIRQAEEMKQKKIKNLKKQIEKLENLKFE
jgi:hypothetical protein